MFKKSAQSIAILLKYAPGLTAVKLVQVLLEAVLTPLSIFFTQRMIDAVSAVLTAGATLRPLFLWGGLLLFALLFDSIGNGLFNGILYISIRRRLNIGMTPDILEKFKRLDYACFEDAEVQDTLTRMKSDPQDKIFNLFLNILGVLSRVISIAGTAMIFAQAGWWFLLGFALLLAPMIWLDFKSADIMNTMFNNQSMDERKMHYLGGLLSNKASLFELKIFRSVDYIAKKWRGISKAVLGVRVKTTLRAQRLFLIVTLLFKAWSFFVVLSLLSSVVSGKITIGLFTALIASTSSVLYSADMLSHGMQNLRQRYLLMEHYYKFMSLPEVADGGEPLKDEPPHIAFENVVFTYPKTDAKILNGVSFEVNPGERVALVGENGAGKSTIVKLLLRLYEPDTGRILINGKDIQTLSAAALRRVFSVVFQDFCKYSLTLRENVAFGDLSKLQDDDALGVALKMGLADGIADLHTPLGNLFENGKDVSGGQWQRIAIARACLADSAFVILDEPTASLDPVAESDMYVSFAEVLHNRGCIMISHRLASAKMADKILVLKDGSVRETGSHGELMKAGGLYARMYESQSAWYTEKETGGVTG